MKKMTQEGCQRLWDEYRRRLGPWFMHAWVDDPQVNSFTKQCLVDDVSPADFPAKLAKYMYDCKRENHNALVEYASTALAPRVMIIRDGTGQI